MAETAAAAATDKAVVEGAVGAGTGATVGKILGMPHAMKSGVGSWTVPLEGRNAGVMVSALAVVNAIGDVRDPATGKIIAGARKTPGSPPEEKEFADSARLMKSLGPTGFTRENTTLVVVATNAALTKVEATKLAQMGQLGMARAINPVNTMSDGDLVVAMSSAAPGGGGQPGRAGSRWAKAAPLAPIDALGVAAAEAVAEAILRAVRMAPSLGGLPGLNKGLKR